MFVLMTIPFGVATCQTSGKPCFICHVCLAVRVLTAVSAISYLAREQTHASATASPAATLPAWTAGSFCTPVGRARAYRDMIWKVGKDPPRNRCVPDSSALRYGTVQEWQQIVERYLQAERQQVPISDDLESRVRMEYVPNDDARVALRGQRRLVARQDVFLTDRLARMCVLAALFVLFCNPERVAPYAGYVVLSAEAQSWFASEFDEVQPYLFHLGHPEPHAGS